MTTFLLITFSVSFEQRYVFRQVVSATRMHKHEVYVHLAVTLPRIRDQIAPPRLVRTKCYVKIRRFSSSCQVIEVAHRITGLFLLLYSV